MIEGGLLSDGIGLAITGAAFAVQKFSRPDTAIPIPVRGVD